MGATLEESLRGPVEGFLLRQGCFVRHEVPLNGRYADILARRSRTLVAVELKLDLWREALHQAMHYQVAAQLAYVAMPLSRSFAPMRQRYRFEKEGVGFLGIAPAGSVRLLLPAAESDRRLPFLTEHVLERWFAVHTQPSATKTC